MINVELTGDFEKLSFALNNISKNLLPYATAVIDEQGDLILKTLQEHVAKQDLGWKPKKIIRLSSDLWVETGELVGSFEAMKVDYASSDYSIFVGVSNNKAHSSGLSATELSIILEYGNSHISARPLFRPTWEEMKPKIEKALKSFMSDFVKSGGVSR